MLHRVSAQTFVTYVRFVDVSCWFVCEFLLRPCDYANVIIISCEIHLDFVQNEFLWNGFCVDRCSFTDEKPDVS